MSTIDPDRWQALSPYLDRALEFGDDRERADWLASLREHSPRIADELQRLLDTQRALTDERFLERAVVSLPFQPATAGQTIGSYTLRSAIGQGGMGTVWLADRSDGRFDRRAAVKLLNLALAGRGEERFKREGRILGRMTHPHIAQLIDAGVTGGCQPFLILEHVDGQPIDRYCDERVLDLEARIRLFLDVLDAIAYAHASLIVHRDIKPSNVLVDTAGQVKLLDFGIAKLLEDEGHGPAATQLTRDGAAALTPEYAAPEQITGAPVTTATDVYALGVLLYVLLTGKHPAGAALRSAADLVKAIVELEAPRASERAPEGRRGALRGDLDTIVAKALKKDPRERYRSVTAFGDDLRRFLGHEPIGARPDSVAYRASKFVRRNRTAAALSALAFLAAIAGVAGTLVQARSARQQRDFAYRQLARAERINYLDRFLLTDAAPSGELLTVNQLLDRAAHIVEREDYTNDAASHVELLISIGIQYYGRRDNNKSLGALEKAYGLSRGLQEPSVRARAACALVSPLTSGFEHTRAETLFQEGLRELPNDPQYALDRAFCLLRGGEVAMTTGAAQQAIDRAESADRALKDSAFQSENLKLGVLQALGASYLMAARYRESIAAYEQAARQLTKLGYDDTRTAAILFHDWGLAVIEAGRPYEAEKIYRRGIEVLRTEQSEDAVTAALLVDYAGALRELGSLTEAADYAERAYVKAKQTNDYPYLTSSLIARTRIYRDQREFVRAAAMLAEVELLVRNRLPAGHYGFASIASERSLLAQSEGHLAQALLLANQAVALDEATIKAGGQGAHLLPSLLIRRSALYLESHQAEAAASEAARALALFQGPATSGEFSEHTGRAYLALGRALLAQGKIEEARAAARSAVEHLERALGPDHVELRDAQQILNSSPQ